MIKVVCAFIFEGEKVLIAQRPSNKSEPLAWEFPGGKVEPEESGQDAIAREIKEELDLEIFAEEKLGSVVYTFGETTIELIGWRCRFVGGAVTLKEHQAFCWVYLSDLLKYNLSKADIVLLEEIKNKLPKPPGKGKVCFNPPPV